MSQNRDVQDRDGVAKGLGQRGDGDDMETAEVVSGQIVPGSWSAIERKNLMFNLVSRNIPKSFWHRRLSSRDRARPSASVRLAALFHGGSNGLLQLRDRSVMPLARPA
jgi:hypothetical protein